MKIRLWFAVLALLSSPLTIAAAAGENPGSHWFFSTDNDQAFTVRRYLLPPWPSATKLVGREERQAIILAEFDR